MRRIFTALLMSALGQTERSQTNLKSPILAEKQALDVAEQGACACRMYLCRTLYCASRPKLSLPVSLNQKRLHQSSDLYVLRLSSVEDRLDDIGR